MFHQKGPEAKGHFWGLFSLFASSSIQLCKSTDKSQACTLQTQVFSDSRDTGFL
jgi:hypothetical protein